MCRKCFVVSPIGNIGSDIRKNADNVYNYIIKPVCKELDFETLRIDKKTTTSVITEDIFDCLDSYDLVIVDISRLNANVFLELGYRIKTKKPYILIKDSNDPNGYPFDIKDIRILEYSLAPDDIECSKQNLKKFVESADFSGKQTIAKTENFEITDDPELGLIIK